jgi:hypothetical protein
MRNTKPEPEISERETILLLEDLCLALRDVGVINYDLPDGGRVIEAITSVRELYTELQHRGVDPHGRLKQLTDETGWLMPQLLEDCVSWPERLPYVRERDGIRRMFRCSLCESEEIPDHLGIWLGTSCLRRVITAIADRDPLKGLILYRTYNSDLRCRHADAETILVVLEDNYDQSLEDSFCEQCIAAELARRAKLNPNSTEP